MITNLITFLKTDIWKIRLSDITGIKSFFIKQLRVVLLSTRGFDEDKCSLKASALTFYTLLSVVPVLAMAFGIAKGFGFEEMLETQLLSRLQGQEEAVQKIIEFSHALLENTKGGLIAGIGVAILFWTIIKLLGNIEQSFNDIWGIRKSRTMGRKFSDYLSAMLICPLLFIMAGSLTVAVSGQVRIIVSKISVLTVFSPLIFAVLKLLPYGLVWLLFTFAYIFMPNTKVKLGAGLMGGIVAGTFFQVLQWAYISFQIGVAKYNAIYGGFAALPLFLIWLEISWLIVLLGAEISFAHQNVHTYEFEPDSRSVSNAFKMLLSLRIVHLIVKHFQQGAPPLTANDIVEALEVPVRLVHQIMDELASSGIVNEVMQESDRSVGYQPARSIEGITIVSVMEAIAKNGSDDFPLTSSRELEKISHSLESFRHQMTGSSDNICLKDI